MHACMHSQKITIKFPMCKCVSVKGGKRGGGRSKIVNLLATEHEIQQKVSPGPFYIESFNYVSYPAISHSIDNPPDTSKAQTNLNTISFINT